MPQPSPVTITSIATMPVTGRYGVGSTITFKLTPGQAVRVEAGAGGTLPYLTLSSSGTAGYVGQDSSGNLLFAYTVAAGQRTSDLLVMGLALNGATVAHTEASFAAPATFSAGSSLRSIVVADLNRDGKADLAVANEIGNGTVSILLGDGSGIFANPTAYAVGSSPASLAVADLNGDGNPDLVTADYYGNAVSILLGDGRGGFAARVSYAAGTNPSAVAVADMDGDGDLDLVAADGPGTVSVLAGDGKGGFAGPASYGTGAGVSSLAVTDLNGDGKPDVVVAYTGGYRSPGPSAVQILLNDGSGRLVGAATYGAAGHYSISIAAADLNGDGRPDLAATSFNGDVSILAGDGRGGLGSPTPYAAGAYPTSVAVADVDGNGKPDLLVTNYYGMSDYSAVDVLLGDGRGGFAQPVAFGIGAGAIRSLAAADVNADGKSDLVATAGSGSTVSVLLNTSPPAASLDPTSAATAPGHDTGLAIRGRSSHDVNGDGRGDLIWQNGNGVPSVWAMTPSGNGASVGTYLNYSNPGASWRLVGTGDLNGDGRADLLWQNQDGTPSAWLVGQGGGFVTDFAVFSNPGPSWRLVGGADLDGNGRADLLWQDADGAVSAWMTAPGGTGVGAYANLTNPGPSWHLVGTGDLDGDGRSDLVFQNDSGAVSAWLIGGSLYTPAVSAYANFSNPGASWHMVGTGDLNGDGRDDLLFQNDSGLPSAWLMAQDGTSVAGYPTFANPGTSWHLRGATDANGDGRADLVWQNDSGQPSLWLMGAGGTGVDSYPVLANPGASWQIREG